ncbi:MAG TPA: YciI family protein [Devosia sp.]|jgi:hypothetical protein|nr:YciI family protein [Devosia sp.]
MTKFLFSYHGGNPPSNPQEGEKTMKAWGDWMGGLGKALVEPGNPTGASKTVGSDGKISAGGGANAVTGYSIVEAKDLDAAVAMAKTCPQLAAKGTIEVAEITPVM